MKYKILRMIAGISIACMLNSCEGGGGTVANPLSATGAQTIKVGVMVPVLNPYFAELGTTYYNGVVLATQLLNAESNLKYKINLVVAYEDPTSISSITNAAQTLAKAGVSAVICGVTSNEAIYSSPIFEPLFIPSFSSAATSNNLRTLINGGSKHLMTGLGQNSSEIPPLLPYVNSSDKVAVIVFTGSNYSENLGDLFYVAVKGIVNTVKLYTYNNNLTAIVNEIANDNSYTKVFVAAPDSVYAGFLFNALIPALSSNVLYFAGDAAYGFNLLSSTTQLTSINNLISSLSFVDLNAANVQLFEAEYKKEFVNLTDPVYAALGFDAANIFYSAIENSTFFQGSNLAFADQVVANVNSVTNYNGVSGITTSFSSNIANRPTFILNGISGASDFSVVSETSVVSSVRAKN